MKSLTNQLDEQELLDRLREVTPQSSRQWGTMTPQQMVCHLNDSFKVAIGERIVSNRSNLISRTAMKWIALNVPLKWPKGVKTMPEVDQQIGGTKPAGFDKDLEELTQILNRFVHERNFEWQAHPIFGAMSEAEWLRWGYLHVDHHLRQFGT